MNWIYYVDLFGTGIFAISGVLTAIHKKFDLIGTLIIGFVTAIGGGTIRDLLIGRFPVGWLKDNHYLMVIFLGYLVAYLFKNQVLKLRKSMFLFDTIGIGIFTISGIEIGLAEGLNFEYCLLMGVISACFGGVIRDVLTNEIPLLFRQEIYASACFSGGLVFLALSQYSPFENINIFISIFIIILIRYFSIKYKWSLNLKVK
jgi:uncharacterized membrane protein YeiH